LFAGCLHAMHFGAGKWSAYSHFPPLQ